MPLRTPPGRNRAPIRARTGAVMALAGLALSLARGAPADQAPEAASAELGKEVAARGWIVYAAKTDQGDYDLFLCRPDGSVRRNITRTPAWSEYGGRFSPEGKRLLFRRTPKGEALNHDLWGATGTLVVANADGSNPTPQGKEGDLPWASWGANDRQFACLYKREGRIRLVEARTLTVTKELPRAGIFQQLFLSSDGQRLCGTANLNGQDWNVISLELATGRATQVSRGLSCTPDWFQGNPDRLIFSTRVPGLATDYGWTMLMQGAADGKSRSLLYGERGRHIYYGCTSPDDRYAVFSVPESDGGVDARMAIIRVADAPIAVPGDYVELQALYPGAKPGPVWRLPQAGFEPHWTYHQVPGLPDPQGP